jgi:hypothetical protein
MAGFTRAGEPQQKQRHLSARLALQPAVQVAICRIRFFKLKSSRRNAIFHDSIAFLQAVPLLDRLLGYCYYRRGGPAVPQVSCSRDL